MKNTIKVIAITLFFTLCYINVNIIASNSNDEGILIKTEFLQAQAYIPPILRDQLHQKCPDPWNPVSEIICQGEGSGCIGLNCP